MEIPKLLWLKKNLPISWANAAHFMDLTDYLTFRATGNTARSVCTLTCKWTYLAHLVSALTCAKVTHHRTVANIFNRLHLMARLQMAGRTLSSNESDLYAVHDLL